MNIDNLCMGCMNELYGEKQCPKCGYYVDSPQISPYLPLKTPLGNKYIVGKVLSSNSEGVTYMAYDTERKTPVVIREFLPEKFIDRNMSSTEVIIKNEWKDYYYAYLRKFLNLWRNIARIRGLSALVPVIDIVEDNNTAYAISEYVECISLREFLLKSQTGYLNWEKAKVLFMPVLSTLSTLHNSGIYHFGINPDNLMIGRDGKLRLSGFSISDARLEGGGFSPEQFEGYTPIEQYSSNGNQGAWSDVYGFCATLYRALVGTVPQDAVSRGMNDQLIIPARYAEIIPAYVINALMNGMQVNVEDRTQDIETLREELSATPGNVVSSFSGANVQRREEPVTITPPVQAGNDKGSVIKTILLVFLIIVGIGLIVFGAYLGYENFIKEEETEPTTIDETIETVVVVPDFVNSSYEMVAQNPVQNTRFRIKCVREYSSEVEKGYIISQSIEPGEEVPTGTEITFVVSNGPEYVEIPAVTDTSVDYAKQVLEEAGFVVNIIIKDNNGDNTEGIVAEVTPGEGERKEKGSNVYIQVWGAPPEEEVETTEKNPFYNPFF